jgi:hypothetical protein
VASTTRLRAAPPVDATITFELARRTVAGFVKSAARLKGSRYIDVKTFMGSSTLLDRGGDAAIDRGHGRSLP